MPFTKPYTKSAPESALPLPGTALLSLAGTAAAVGLPLAATGSAGYMAPGHSQTCGSACLGYVYLPAVLVTSLAAVAAAPLGATRAHRGPALWLKRAFALSLAIVIADLVLKLLQSASTIASRLRSGLLDPMESA
jgi:uncharacterized membrane protein YfcA